MVLSEPVARIHAELKKKYDLTFTDLRLKGKDLSLLQIANIEPFLTGKDIFKDVSNFPYWIKLWESAMVLADLMAGLSHPPGETLLEVGAGLGAAGLAAAANGYEVTISDYQEEILDFPRVSAEASGLGNVRFQRLDWLDPPADLPRYQVIIGAEILFRETFFEPLLDIFNRALLPGGTIYLAHDIRRQSMPRFLLKAEKYYQVAVSTRKIKEAGETITIIVNRLQAK